MERSIGWLLISARLLLAVVFLLNGFGVINQAIPAKEMIERGMPAAVVPFAMFAGRFLEIVAGLGLALGIFPRWSAFLLFAFLVPATFVSHSFWLAAGTPQFQGQLINFCKNVAIWGGLVFIAAAANQPSLLPQNKNTLDQLGQNISGENRLVQRRPQPKRYNANDQLGVDSDERTARPNY